MQRMHEEMAERFGNAARADHPRSSCTRGRENRSRQATFRISADNARDKNFERHAVADERELMSDALKRSMG